MLEQWNPVASLFSLRTYISNSSPSVFSYPQVQRAVLSEPWSAELG